MRRSGTLLLQRSLQLLCHCRPHRAVFFYLVGHATNPTERCLRASPKHSLICLALYLLLHGLPNHACAQQQSASSTTEAQLPNSQANRLSEASPVPSSTVTVPSSSEPASRSLPKARPTQPNKSLSQATTDASPSPRSLPAPSSSQSQPPDSSRHRHPALSTPERATKLPQITLPSVTTAIDVQVTASPQEVAQAQIEAEEQQRVLGAIPNFYVSYVSHPVPLVSRSRSSSSPGRPRRSRHLRRHRTIAASSKPTIPSPATDRGRRATASATPPPTETQSSPPCSATPSCPRSSDRTRATSTKEPAPRDRAPSTPSPTPSSAKATTDTGSPTTLASLAASPPADLKPLLPRQPTATEPPSPSKTPHRHRRNRHRKPLSGVPRPQTNAPSAPS